MAMHVGVYIGIHHKSKLNADKTGSRRRVLDGRVHPDTAVSVLYSLGEGGVLNWRV